MTLPNFLVIGAGRSGTTALHAYLGQHPQVFVSDLKEPNFFVLDEPPRSDWLRRTAVRTLPAYEALFEGAGDATAIGEATPTYLRSPESPELVRAVIPHARLVAILRHPVERAYSAYLGWRRDGVERTPTFEAALRDDALARRYLGPSFYHESLSRWYAAFPAEQLRVYLHDDLRDDARGLLADLFGFLGVDTGFVPDLTERPGQTGMVANPVLRAVWERAEAARRAVRPAVPERLRDRAYARVTRDLVRPPLAPELRSRLVERFEPDIVALEGLLERDLSAWRC